MKCGLLPALARLASFLLAMTWGGTCAAQGGSFGVAKVNINPLQPVMLSGYAGRSTLPEATSVQRSIVAQAAAFGDGAETALLITVDCTGMPDTVVDPVSQRLSEELGVAREKIVITCTHSHSCPHVQGYAPNLFSPPLSASRQANVAAYTEDLVGWLEQVASEALANRTPGHEISWGNGSVGFGRNRRGTAIQANDHDLPVMLVQDSNGQPKAIITSYATHAVTLNGNDNVVNGDWPGYARERIEALFPGAAALVMIGAGADSNPNPQGGVSAALNHGQSIANEVQRLITQNLMTPVSQNIVGFHTELELDYATERLPGDPVNARLAPSPGSTLYGVTSWTFGDDLAMVFMEGEVVADYSLRLKSELGDNVWVNAYANGVQGYIPSERILYEGGYEGDGANYYYGLPGRFAHGLEDKIVGAVHEHLFDFLGLADRLQLIVDWKTGAATISNLGEKTLTIDGYTIVSETGALNPAPGGWHSFQEQGLAGWDRADNSSAYRLTEFAPTGSLTLAPGVSHTLGRAAVLPAPSKFGDPVEAAELHFEYSLQGIEVEEGVVQALLADAPINNLVLTIDPATGEAAIQNASPFFDVSVAAYTITSQVGGLLPGDGAWDSLQDQDAAGWDEADNASAFRITEFNATGATPLEGAGTVLYLGAPIDVSDGAPVLSDLHFEFLLSTGEVLEGAIVLGALPNEALGGDFDADGDVDGADFLLWQRTLGTTASPPGSGADGDGNGTVGAGDLAVWKAAFGAGGGAAAGRVVPEPCGAAICLASLAAGVTRRRQ